MILDKEKSEEAEKTVRVNSAKTSRMIRELFRVRRRRFNLRSSMNISPSVYRILKGEVYMWWLIIIGILLGILLSYLYFRVKVELMAHRLGEEIGKRIFEEKKSDLERMFEEKYKFLLEKWMIDAERRLREDALAKSRAVLKGKIAEQLAPLFAVFGYAPSDARFIGDPVDYIIFDGYTSVKERMEDKPIRIVLADIKTGDSSLTYEQRRIKEGIERGLVKFEVIRM